MKVRWRKRVYHTRDFGVDAGLAQSLFSCANDYLSDPVCYFTSFTAYAILPVSTVVHESNLELKRCQIAPSAATTHGPLTW